MSTDTQLGQDRTQLLQQAIVAACESKTPVNITAGDSKKFYGRTTSTAHSLSVKQHQGIISYYPSELVITARTGTLLSTLEQVLAEQGQMLAFEAPSFAQQATLGGVVASGLSGPRRAFTGSVRDFVLGCKLINGRAEVLNFGGQTIKNVAGYDVSRLMTGSMGTLALILEVSLKVLPKPELEQSCSFSLTPAQAWPRMAQLAAQCLPISGLSYDGERLYARLSGAETAVQSALKTLGGDRLNQRQALFWQDLNEHRLEFFNTEKNIWRIAVPPAHPPLTLSGDWFYDWAGGLRWLVSDELADNVFSVAGKAGGHALLFRNNSNEEQVFQPLSGQLQVLNRNIKQAFDPLGIFNPQRMYKEW